MARKSTRTRRKGGPTTRRAAASKVRRIARELSHDVNGLAYDVSDVAGAVGAKTKAQLAALAHLAQARAHGAFEGFEHQVRTRPALSVGAAMGVGVIAGLLLARRH
ncbi:MAG: hypothetical protein ACREH4_13225 [Vitreimonas sp.]